MMKMKVLTFLISSALLSIACSKDKSDDPSKNIIGKWELIAQGYSEDKIESVDPLENKRHLEYSNNGEIRYYNSLMQEYRDSMYTYKIDKEFLYYYYYDRTPSNVDNDYVYKYKFDKSNNELTLKYFQGNIEASMLTPRIWVYKRIK